MADELYVKVGSTIEPVALEAGTAPEYVERIEAVEEAVPALDSSLRTLIAKEVAKCLKTSGGMMTGALSIGEHNNILAYTSDTTNGYKYIILQSDSWGAGSRIQMMRGDSPSDPGVLVLVSGGTDFRIKPDGKAYVQHSPVLTSAGGAMNGKLTFGIEQAVTKNDDVSILRVIGATSYANGGNLVLYGKGHNNKGAVELQARDGANTGVLRVLANGSATLASKPVIALTASWADGAGNWYRKYSDGWIEQGGRYSSLVARGQSTITLHTAFTSSNYTVSLTGTNCLGSHHLYDTNSLGVVSQTSTSMTIEQYNSDTDSYWGTAIWYACGY